ncbi:MAG TPA: AtpZ/AtpI family protein [Deltaproteobacteria bacterium]|jgi:F0F1-type ATP synthase assembly protein I|nr:AtpZ/AtpI family protein [Deltaproteobacteria bacterium]HQI01300.1 AtpZ/AtpI family protein [Deltaproteobacteria bacterium]HQJ07884.1 AtpZ/AtpI family protein [Deltaproteobacteria bacterium]
MKKQKRKIQTKALNQIIMISAWSFTLVVSSFLFLFAGRWIDVRMGTEPTFMLGLLVLGIALCIGRMYTDYAKVKEQLNIRRAKVQHQ